MAAPSPPSGTPLRIWQALPATVAAFTGGSSPSSRRNRAAFPTFTNSGAAPRKRRCLAAPCRRTSGAWRAAPPTGASRKRHPAARGRLAAAPLRSAWCCSAPGPGRFRSSPRPPVPGKGGNDRRRSPAHLAGGVRGGWLTLPLRDDAPVRLVASAPGAFRPCFSSGRPRAIGPRLAGSWPSPPVVARSWLAAGPGTPENPAKLAGKRCWLALAGGFFGGRNHRDGS